MVERVPGEGDLPAVRGDLDDAAATLAAKVRQRGADELDRPEEVGRQDVLDLRVGGLLGRAEQAVARVADDDVDASEGGEGAVDERADRRRFGHVEHPGMERARVALDQVTDLGGVADRSDDAVSAREELLGEVASEAAADAGDEP